MSLLNPLSASFWMGIGTALLCGTIVGLERQFRGKPVGIRTSALICLGTEIFVSIGESLQSTQGDPARVIGQIITGIGFLGAGVIMAQGGKVVGVTSAAVVWVLAAVGILIGLHQYATAVIISCVASGILVVVDVLERRVKWMRRGFHSIR